MKRSFFLKKKDIQKLVGSTSSSWEGHYHCAVLNMHFRLHCCFKFTIWASSCRRIMSLYSEFITIWYSEQIIDYEASDVRTTKFNSTFDSFISSTKRNWNINFTFRHIKTRKQFGCLSTAYWMHKLPILLCNIYQDIGALQLWTKFRTGCM